MKSVVTAILLVCVLSLARPSHAAVIEYVATDLADVVAGQDLWEYQYFVSGFTFGVNEGFSVYASDSLYQDLVTPAPPNADWLTEVIQPDIVLGDAGWLDGLALVPGASLADPFVVQFVWLGGPKRPGSQPFDIYALDALGDFSIIESGRTVAPGVPEPALGLLTALGALIAGGRTLVRRRRRA